MPCPRNPAASWQQLPGPSVEPAGPRDHVRGRGWGADGPGARLWLSRAAPLRPGRSLPSHSCKGRCAQLREPLSLDTRGCNLPLLLGARQPTFVLVFPLPRPGNSCSTCLAAPSGAQPPSHRSDTGAPGCLDTSWL
ncbi:small ribosomal subunit protein bS6m isoform X1 [Petaurus breviceps papuanus]|uniref:small ribosomal subunit protein bS6m isoform X1 n=1 Tax=Petaurus breviceps papuanus TaxID=3040969 RepID=UPI0036DEA47E